MSENNKNNQNDQPTDKQQPSNDTQVIYREISEDELKQILEDHKKWLESDGKEGERADFSLKNTQKAILDGVNFEKVELRNANLKYASLVKANLRKANLSESNLEYAKLKDANLQKTILDGANLQETNFFKANMQKADLSNANLKNAFLNRANLNKAEFYKANMYKATFLRANLHKAILSESKMHKANLGKANIQNTELEGIEGLSQANLQYANLEGATGLLGNEFAQADVTGTKLPEKIEEFKALEIVKETSQNARKIFFAMLLGCVYSWLTIATTTDVKLLTNTASSPLPIIGTEIPIAWFYIAAPLVLICLYFYFHLYLLKLWEALSGLPAIFPDGKRLDERAYPWLLNGLVRRHFELLKKGRPFIAHEQEFITIFLAWWVIPITMIAFWMRYIPRHDWFGTSFHIILILVSVGFANSFYHACSLILQGKINASIGLKRFWSDKRLFYSIFKIILFSVVIFFVGFLFSLLSDGAINGIRPDKNYKPVLDDLQSIEQIVPWAFERIGYDVFADFREKTVSEIPLNYGEISKDERLNFVKGANLKKRNLLNADMYKAFLVNADLQNALLKGANLNLSNLQNANLMRANLHRANLNSANLQKTLLVYADLSKANLFEANLQQSDLREANLEQANLSRTNLQNTLLIGANLKDSDLSESNLHGAKLIDSNLEGVDYRYANLKDADLRYATLVGAKNLTIEQLSKVKTLYLANFNAELLEQIKKSYPHLLEEPKSEIESIPAVIE